MVHILRDILKSKCSYDKKESKKILKELSSNKYGFSIFKKLVLYVVNHDWENYKDIFWNILSCNKQIFHNSSEEVELYVENNWNGALFLGYLDEFKETKDNIEYIADIMIEMLKESTPVYPKETVCSLLKKIYKDSPKKAEKIRDIYLSMSIGDFVKEFWDKEIKS